MKRQLDIGAWSSGKESGQNTQVTDYRSTSSNYTGYVNHKRTRDNKGSKYKHREESITET